MKIVLDYLGRPNASTVVLARGTQKSPSDMMMETERLWIRRIQTANRSWKTQENAFLP